LLSAEAERFERRLTEQVSALRLELHDGLGAVRQEFRQEFATIRHEMANLKADILKWSFLFWIGQVATMAALLSFMLHH
jgi:hypothetical protein